MEPALGEKLLGNPKESFRRHLSLCHLSQEPVGLQMPQPHHLTLTLQEKALEASGEDI